MRAGVGLSRKPDVREAAHEAAARALEGFRRAGALLVAASVDHVDESIDLCQALRDVAGDVPIVGVATEAAAIPGDADEEEGPVLAALALERATPFVMRRDDPSLGIAAEAAGPGATALVFVDPAASLNHVVGKLAAVRLRAAGGGAAVDGGLLFGDDVIEAEAVGVVIPSSASIAVAQSHQPIGEPMLVTRADGHSIHEIDGKPAVEALSSLDAQPGITEDALQFLGLGVSPEPGEAFRGDDFVAVPLLGVDDETGSLEVGSPVREGTSVSFTLRDAMGARRSLSTALDRLGTVSPSWGMYFDCASRGSSLHGMPGLDLRVIEQRLGRFPLLAWRTSFELGPSGPSTGVHLFTGVLAVGS